MSLCLLLEVPLLTETSRETVTEEFKMMLRAVEVVLKKFPGIRHDIAQAKQDPSFLISKIRKVRGLIRTRLSATHGYMRAVVCNVWIYACGY